MHSCVPAQAYIEGGRFEEAEKDATSVLEVKPDNLKALNRRAIARFRRTIPDTDGARADLITLLTLKPGAHEVSFFSSPRFHFWIRYTLGKTKTSTTRFRQTYSCCAIGSYQTGFYGGKMLGQKFCCRHVSSTNLDAVLLEQMVVMYLGELFAFAKNVRVRTNPSKHFVGWMRRTNLDAAGFRERLS